MALGDISFENITLAKQLLALASAHVLQFVISKLERRFCR